VCGGENGKGRK